MGKNTPTPLTDTKLRKAKPTDKPYKLTDAGGLFVLVHPSGGKRWRYKYRFAGKEKLLSLGTYPDVSLSEARDRHAKFWRLAMIQAKSKRPPNALLFPTTKQLTRP